MTKQRENDLYNLVVSAIDQALFPIIMSHTQNKTVADTRKSVELILCATLFNAFSLAENALTKNPNQLQNYLVSMCKEYCAKLEQLNKQLN